MEWIKVTDRLPDPNIMVLVNVFPKYPVMEGSIITIDRRIKVSNKHGSTIGRYITEKLGSNDFTKGEVTHWMPLPERPKH